VANRENFLTTSSIEETLASSNLPSPRGVALQLIQLTRKEDVTNQEIAHIVKADPALAGRIIKAANILVAYQTRPIVSVVDAVTVLGFNSVRQLVLGLSLIDSNLAGECDGFDYQNFWGRSLLSAIAAQHLNRISNIAAPEEVFILGLLSQVGSLALAATHPQEYARLLKKSAGKSTSELLEFEAAEFGFNHNQLTGALLANWNLPPLFREIVLRHEDPDHSGFAEGSRNRNLANILHIADLFAQACTTREQLRRKMIPNLILTATRSGVEIEALNRIGDESVNEWHEWSKLCGIRTIDLPPFAQLLEAVPFAPAMPHIGTAPQEDASTFYKLRILVVDDDSAIQMLLTRLLEKAGHSVAVASNGIEGLKAVRNFMPQLIITDWIMPEMDGIGFCKALRQNSSWRNIYVFILTAQEGAEKLVEAFEAGVNDYMSKPINTKLLLARLRAGQRVVQLQDEMEFDRQQLHAFADELVAFNQRLHKSDASLRAMLDNSPFMAWLKDSDGRYVRVNKSFATFAGHQDTSRIIGKTDTDIWPKKLADKHLADDAEVIRTRQQKRIEEVLQTGSEIRWLETFKTPVIDENANILGTTGFAHDITERKMAEAELRIAATAFESQEGMMVTDADLNILRINQAFTEITGYSAKDVAGQTPHLLKSGRHDEAFYEAMWKSIHETGAWSGEIWNRRKDGEIYPEQLTITAVKDETGKVTNYVATLSDITLRKASEAQIYSLAYYDTLTHLPNRRLLNDRLSQAMAMNKRNGVQGALMFLDLDNFKPLNDTHGHGVGDLLLEEAARRISGCIRKADTVARFGGDEFVIMLSELGKDSKQSSVQAMAVAEKIRTSLSEPYFLKVRRDDKKASTITHQCTSSIGVTLFTGKEAHQDDILKLADLAMYEAKEAGRNRVVIR
jgi:two-component system, cell cycle response regulator